jgi:tetratricopeptide (TPR) repeat protein
MRRSQVKWIQASSATWSEPKRLYINLGLILAAEISGSIVLAILLRKGFFWLPQYRADPQRLLRSQEEHNLGCLNRARGWVDTAEEMFRRALETREKALGRDHTSTLATVNELSLVYRDQGKLDKAQEMFWRVLEGHEKALGHDHTSTLATVNELGLVYRNQGKSDTAEEMFRRALEGREKALGCDHTLTLATVHELSLVYRDQGKSDTAEEMFRRVLEGREKALGRDHTSTLATVNKLGLVYRDQGKLDKAAEMFWRVLEGHEKALGRDHTLTLSTVNREALGRDYTSTLATVNELGIVYRNQGKLDKAEEMFRRALEGREKALGAQSHVNACHSQRVGPCLQELGQARHGRGDVLTGVRRTWKALRRDHTLTLPTVNKLGLL